MARNFTLVSRRSGVVQLSRFRTRAPGAHTPSGLRIQHNSGSAELPVRPLSQSRVSWLRRMSLHGDTRTSADGE
jgi:hypothetical protein